jgi:hypothetical protein
MAGSGHERLCSQRVNVFRCIPKADIEYTPCHSCTVALVRINSKNSAAVRLGTCPLDQGEEGPFRKFGAGQAHLFCICKLGGVVRYFNLMDVGAYLNIDHDDVLPPSWRGGSSCSWPPYHSPGSIVLSLMTASPRWLGSDDRFQ